MCAAYAELGISAIGGIHLTGVVVWSANGNPSCQRTLPEFHRPISGVVPNGRGLPGLS